MASFVMPDQVTALPAEQQEAIRKVLIECHLITEAGELANLTAENMPEKYKAALDAFGIETENLNLRLIPLSQVDQYLGRNFYFNETHAVDPASIIPCRRGRLLATAWSGRHRAG